MPISEKQLQANRENALRSTGPKTEKGKAVSRCNALKHGMTATSILLPDEEQKVFEAFSANLYQDLQPVGALEGFLVERVVALAWRLKRIGRVETGIYILNCYQEMYTRAENERTRYRDLVFDTSEDEFLRAFLPLESHTREIITDQKAYDAATKTMGSYRARRNSLDTVIGEAFIKDFSSCEALNKLSQIGRAHV